MATRFTDCEGFHRRDFLKVGSAGLLGLTLADLLRLEARAARAFAAVTWREPAGCLGANP